MPHTASNDPYDYEQNYPPDAPYRELSPSARVWRTCMDENKKIDADLLGGWRDSLDVLLVFVRISIIIKGQSVLILDIRPPCSLLS